MNALLSTGNPFARPTRVLITGEFWHSDFVDLINQLGVSTMLINLDKLLQLRELDECFDLIIIAQARRGMVTESELARIRKLIPQCPIVTLLGTWCEGEQRSGTPLRDVSRIYWHQWNGDIARLQELARLNLSYADAATDFSISTSSPAESAVGGTSLKSTVAISALSLTQFEMVRDSLQAIGIRSIWVEKTAWDGDANQDIQCIVVDCESQSENLVKRLTLVREIIPSRPLLLMLSFPRKGEMVSLKKEFGVAEFISKPFELATLAAALNRSGLFVPRSIVPTSSVTQTPSIESPTRV